VTGRGTAIDVETETVTETGMNVIEMVTEVTTIVGTGGTTIVRGREGTANVPMAVTETEKEDTIGIEGGRTGAEIGTEVERNMEPGEALLLLEE
jgi:hypothetical protein